VTDGQPVSPPDLRLLAEAAAGPGVQAVFLTQRPDMERVLEHVVAANSAQMQDPAFVAELKDWIRFSEAEAERSGDGLFTGASGNLSTPRWLGTRDSEDPGDLLRLDALVRSLGGHDAFPSRIGSAQ